MNHDVKRILALVIALLLALPAFSLADGIADAAADPEIFTESVEPEVALTGDLEAETSGDDDESPETADDTGETPEDADEDVILAEAVDGLETDGETTDELSLTDDGPLTFTVTPERVFTYIADDGTDNEALLDAYVQQLLDASLGKAPKKRLFMAGTRLTGINQAVYQIIKAASKEIAEGTRTSTIISITIDQLKKMGVDCGPWTASDLRVDAIVEGNAVTQASKEAARDKLGLDMSAILNALLADCPYELYWFDKTQGFFCEGLKIAIGSNGTEYTFSYVEDTSFTLPVANAYAGTDEYTVNTARISTVKTAIQNAQSIVSGSSGSVLERITRYKDSICERVSYSHDAAENNDTPYGDPWQLIHVFDGDSSTNVVCEGYAKAFKYLFDLSGFGDSYDCLLVTGKMNGGNHMWNLVRMEDGGNYLVDVTNCDKGTVGAPDKLFMAYGPSGSWNDYTFSLGSSSIRYCYDEDTLGTFSQSELTLSSAPYAAAASTHTPTPTATGEPADEPASAPTPTPTPTPAPTPKPAPTTPVIKATKNIKATVNVGTVYKLDLGGAAGKSFKSSNKKVAAVSAAGLITPRKAGKAKITFKVGKKKRTVTLTVKDPTIPTSVRLSLSGTVAAKVGERVALKVTLPKGTKSDIKWKSSSKKIATVSNGTVTFKKAGTVTITATASRDKKKAKVKFRVSK